MSTGDYCIGDYGIVANVIEPDRILRRNAKAWLAGGTGGEGWDRFVWIGLSRSPRRIKKWAPTIRFHNFRVVWVPPHLAKDVWYFRGTRKEMERVAAELDSFAAELRAKRSAQPNETPA